MNVATHQSEPHQPVPNQAAPAECAYPSCVRSILGCRGVCARGKQPPACRDCYGIGYDASGQLCGCQD